MILSLRQRHRRVFAWIGVLLPIAFVVGVAARKPLPAITSLPAELAGAESKRGATILERGDLFAKPPVTVRLSRGDDNTLSIAFSAKEDFVKPDLLVYWVAGTPAVTDKLPEGAVLLGAFSAAILRLPMEVTSREGSLILFSLANQEVVAVSQAFTPERGSATRSNSEQIRSRESSAQSQPQEVLRLTEPRSDQ